MFDVSLCLHLSLLERIKRAVFCMRTISAFKKSIKIIRFSRFHNLKMLFSGARLFIELKRKNSLKLNWFTDILGNPILW